MKAVITFLSALLLAGSASAYTLEIDIPAGPGLDRLIKLCDWLRADTDINKPGMTNKECGRRLFLRGAFEFNHDMKFGELRTAAKAAMVADDAAIRLDLPKPADGPPTSSPTVSPTVSPTATPTP